MDRSGDWPVLDALIRWETGLPGGAYRREDLARALGRSTSRIEASLDRLRDKGLCRPLQEMTFPHAMRVTSLGYEDWVALYGDEVFPELKLFQAVVVDLASRSWGVGRVASLQRELVAEGVVVDVRGVLSRLHVLRGLGRVEIVDGSPLVYRVVSGVVRGVLISS